MHPGLRPLPHILVLAFFLLQFYIHDDIRQCIYTFAEPSYRAVLPWPAPKATTSLSVLVLLRKMAWMLPCPIYAEMPVRVCSHVSVTHEELLHKPETMLASTLASTRQTAGLSAEQQATLSGWGRLFSRTKRHHRCSTSRSSYAKPVISDFTGLRYCSNLPSIWTDRADQGTGQSNSLSLIRSYRPLPEPGDDGAAMRHMRSRPLSQRTAEEDVGGEFYRSPPSPSLGLVRQNETVYA